MRLILKGALLGKRAHSEMAPRHRLPDLEDDIPANAVDSAVLVLLNPTNDGESPKAMLDWRVLLIRRNSYPGVHSGQIAFPGGKRETTDAGLWATACREAFEEVGIEKEGFRKVGALSGVYIPPSNFAVYPFVAVCKTAVEIKLDPREVVDYKNVPVGVFDPAKSAEVSFDYKDGTKRAAPAWLYEDFTIWGATAMILAEVYRLIERAALTRV